LFAWDCAALSRRLLQWIKLRLHTRSRRRLKSKIFLAKFLQSPHASNDFSTVGYRRQRLYPFVAQILQTTTCYRTSIMVVHRPGRCTRVIWQRGQSHKSSVPSGVKCRVKSSGFWRPDGPRVCAGIAAVALCTVVLGGCATRPATQAQAKLQAKAQANTSSPSGRHACSPRERGFPLPDRTLLQRQAEPDCIFRGTISIPITGEELRQKLDYEQQCYRQSESNVRVAPAHPAGCGRGDDQGG